METQSPTHLLSSLGILFKFQIAKKISKDEIVKETRKIKKIFKNADSEKVKKLLADVIINKVKKSSTFELPPGLILPKTLEKKESLDKFYTELAIISQTLSNKFIEQKLTKHQICFIVNAIVHTMKLSEEDFLDFQKKFQKYKDGDFNEEEE